jgi:FtsP/CotA-like multicopper oxidase with cupredoxin domain
MSRIYEGTAPASRGPAAGPSGSAPTRREFLRSVAGGTGAVALGSSAALSGLLTACTDPAGPAAPADGDLRYPVDTPPSTVPRDLVLVAAPGSADIGGAVAPGWLLNGVLPSPLLRVRRGEVFRVNMINQLAQDLILHWHGIAPPVLMDGHPRLAVPPGGSYQYEFTVQDRAGTYWYHPHTHMHTAEQVYRGMAGFFIVDDPAEAALGLPSGEREMPLLLQDRRVDATGVPYYEPSLSDLMAGYMGTEAFTNGVRRAYRELDSAVYRFRILNGSNARIFRVALGDGRPMVLIGNDGGLLPAPHVLTSIDMAPGERIDVLVDLRDAQVGDNIMLRSRAFTIPGGAGFMGGANLQGEPLDLVELRVTRRVQDSATIPTSLPPVPGPDPAQSVRERTFRFRSLMTEHLINGTSFDLERVDERVTFGETEIWHFVNDSPLPHPVHLHATHFRVLARSGGRAAVLPWEMGRKDTVLLNPLETIDVAVRFEASRGLFLLHCHNLEHEDMGMMLNILVE